MRVLFLCVEDLFNTGILQSMVLKPARLLHEKFGYEIGLTSMARGSDLHGVAPGFATQLITGKRHHSPLSLQNLALHALFALKILVRAKRYDVYYCRSYLATLIGCICRLFFGGAVIFDVRGFLIDEATESGKIKPHGVVSLLLRKMEALLFRHSDTVIAVSDAMEKEISRLFGRSDVVVIKNPADFSYGTSCAPTNLASERTIAYNGSLNSWHEPELFFSVAKVLIDQFGFRVRIVTNDPKTAKTLSARHRLKATHVTILTCAAEHVVDHLRECTIGWCAISNTYSKSVCWPVKFNEYLAAGLPAIVNSNIGDLDEYVHSFGVGIVIELSDTPASICEKIVGYLEKNKVKPFKVPKQLKRELSWNTQIARVMETIEITAKLKNKNT